MANSVILICSKHFTNGICDFNDINLYSVAVNYVYILLPWIRASTQSFIPAVPIYIPHTMNLSHNTVTYECPSSQDRRWLLPSHPWHSTVGDDSSVFRGRPAIDHDYKVIIDYRNNPRDVWCDISIVREAPSLRFAKSECRKQLCLSWLPRAVDF
jgi:hypothetical protein